MTWVYLLRKDAQMWKMSVLWRHLFNDKCHTVQQTCQLRFCLVNDQPLAGNLYTYS